MKVQALVLLGGAVLMGCVPPPKKERVEMFAIGAAASSEGLPGNIDFSAVQATGSPDVGGCGDNPAAWSPETANAPLQSGTNWNEFIELTYESYVFVEAVRVYETYNPGAIVQIDVEASDNSVPPLNLYLDGNGEPGACPSVLATYVETSGCGGQTCDEYNRVVIYLNTNLIQDANGNGNPDDDYNAIDAVMLVGDRYVD